LGSAPSHQKGEPQSRKNLRLKIAFFMPMIHLVDNVIYLNRVDPKITEHYLLTQPDVIDASVWFESGEMRAHVTLLDSTELTPRELRLRCACELGLHHTPKQFVCLSARPRAA